MEIAFEKIVESIAEADKVLVGVGDELAVSFSDLTGGKDVDEYEKARILEKCIHLKQDKAYQILKDLLQDKDYYLISLNMDSAIHRVFDNRDRLVLPCGDLSLLQCEKACCKDLYEAKKIPAYPFMDGDVPECPACQSRMVYNNLYAENYLEEGYLPAWDSYQNWLKTTVNKKLCIIELGCSLKFPTIIRFAFDKLAMYNQKATFYRVHESLWQHAKETEDRGISIKENALSFLCKNSEKC